MAPRLIRVQVYFWPEDRDGKTVWCAECVTLNLADERPTYEQVSAAIIENISSYLKFALAGDPKGLVPRKSSLARRAQLRLAYSLSHLRSAASHPVYFEDRPVCQAPLTA